MDQENIALQVFPPKPIHFCYLSQPCVHWSSKLSYLPLAAKLEVTTLEYFFLHRAINPHRYSNLQCVTITMRVLLYICLNFPRLGKHSHNSLQLRSASLDLVGWVITGQAFTESGCGQNVRQVVVLAEDSRGQLPYLLNTENGREEGLW
jgi:hypothetical protein